MALTVYADMRAWAAAVRARLPTYARPAPPLALAGLVQLAEGRDRSHFEPVPVEWVPAGLVPEGDLVIWDLQRDGGRVRVTLVSLPGIGRAQALEVLDAALAAISVRQPVHLEAQLAVSPLEGYQLSGLIRRATPVIVPPLPVPDGVRFPSRRVTARRLRCGLTDLPATEPFLARVDEVIHAEGERGGGVLVALDLDHFQEFNHALGFQAGDQALVDVADALVEGFPDAWIGRTGGNRFTLCVPGGRAEDARARVEALNHQRGNRPEGGWGAWTGGAEGEARPFPTVSVGVVTFPRDGQDVEALLWAAEALVSEAKMDGRPGVRLHDPERSPLDAVGLRP